MNQSGCQIAGTAFDGFVTRFQKVRVRKVTRDLMQAQCDTPSQAFDELIRLTTEESADAFDSEHLQVLLRPFLVNPQRHMPHVIEICRYYAISFLGKSLIKASEIGFLKLIPGLSRLCFAPALAIIRKQFLEQFIRLKEELQKEAKVGETIVHVGNVRYLDTPSGYAGVLRNRYLLEIQVALEPVQGDEASVLDAQLVFEAGEAEIEIGDISPKSASRSVSIEETTTSQHSQEQAVSGKISSEIEASAQPIKSKIASEISESEKFGTVQSAGVKRTFITSERQVLARRAGRKAFWRLQRDVEPVDIGSVDFTASFLVAHGVKDVEVEFGVTVEWLRAGKITTGLNRTMTLPKPPVTSTIIRP